VSFRGLRLHRLLGKALLVNVRYYPRNFDEMLRACAFARFAELNGLRVRTSFECPLVKNSEGEANLELVRFKGFRIKLKKPFILDIPSMPLWLGEGIHEHLAYHLYSRKSLMNVTQSENAAKLLQRELINAKAIPFQPPEDFLKIKGEGRYACVWFPKDLELEDIEKVAVRSKLRNYIIVLGRKSKVLRSVSINNIGDLMLYLKLCKAIISLRYDVGPLPPYEDKPERTLARALKKGLVSDDCIKPDPLDEAIKEAMKSPCEEDYPRAMENFWGEVLELL